MKDAKMCTMIRGAAYRLWLLKIWCVHWKRIFNRTDDSQFRHFPCIFHKFQGHFFTKLCLKNFVFGNCVHAGVYCDTLKKLRRAIQNKRRGMFSRGVVILHDNFRPYIAAATQDLIATFGWEQFDHPPYSPDSAPNDFHVFLDMKTFLSNRRFRDDNEVKEAVNTWFASQAASFYDAGIQKLVPRYDKCLNNGGKSVENSVRYVHQMAIYVVWK
jgi:histone-lysine N-methyltransferase SETMAR